MVIFIVDGLDDERDRAEFHISNNVCKRLPEWATHIDGAFTCEFHAVHLSVGRVLTERGVLSTCLLLHLAPNLTEDCVLALMVNLASLFKRRRWEALDGDVLLVSLWKLGDRLVNELHLH